VTGAAAWIGAERLASSDDEPDDRLDRGLERLHALPPGISLHHGNHVAMVIEALGVLGRADAIEPWLEENFQALAEPVKPRPIDPGAWRAALGRTERFADWCAFFARALDEDDWRGVLRTWVPRLAPGLAAAATHGVIRSGHAARALAARDNAIRRRELATGLGYWAASYQELPWDGSEAPESSVEAALARIETRLPAVQPPRGNIIAGLSALAETPSFTPVAGLVDTRDPARTLAEMSTVFGRLYLRHPGRRVHFTHAITAPSALRLLAPHLDDETVHRATRYAWQAAAGLWVVYGDPKSVLPPERPALEREALVSACVRNGGAHSIKLTEACLRERAWSDDPVLERVARDAAENLDG